MGYASNKRTMQTTPILQFSKELSQSFHFHNDYRSASMKTIPNTISLPKSIFAVCVCAMLSLAACGGKDSNPQPTTGGPVELPTNVLGTFTGVATYTKPGTTAIVNNSNAKATLTKTGDKTYSIMFSDNIPTITNLTFQDTGGGVYGSLGEDGTGAGVGVSAKGMAIGYTKDTAGWQFQGTK